MQTQVPEPQKAKPEAPCRPARPITVAVVDDDQLVPQALQLIFRASAGIRLQASYQKAEDALRSVPGDPPDVMLMDIGLPGMSGIEGTRKLRSVLPHLPIVMLSASIAVHDVCESLMAGASGYLTKPPSPAELETAVEEVCRGEVFLSKPVLKALVLAFHQIPSANLGSASLTQREQQVMGFLFNGYLDKEIADAMHVGQPTVRTFLQHLFRKVEANSRTQAVHNFLR